MVDMTEIKVLKVIYKKKCHQAIAKHEKLMDLVNFSCHPFLIFCQMADNKIKILINWQLLFLNLCDGKIFIKNMFANIYIYIYLLKI